MATGISVPSLHTQQLAGFSETEREAPYGTARNKASQCQATLVVKMQLKDVFRNAEEMLASRGVAEEVVKMYYTRLLEDTVGVCPVGPALDLAMACLGLSLNNIRAQTKVVGGVLQVAGSAPVPPQPPGLPAQQLAVLNTLQPLMKVQQDKCLVGASTNCLHSQGDAFDRLVHKYTYPFNCTRSLYKSCPPAQVAAAALARQTALHQRGNSCAEILSNDADTAPQLAAAVACSADCRISAVCKHAADHGCGPAPVSYPSCGCQGVHCGSAGGAAGELSAELYQELAQEFLITARTVFQAQQHFVAIMSDSLNKRHATNLRSWGISSSDVEAVVQLLQAPAAVKLGLTMVYYLYTKCFLQSDSFPPQLLQHLKAQAAAGSRAKGLQAKRRSTFLSPGTSAAAAAASMTGIAVDETDFPEKWDLGIELLLQGKAEEAEHLRQYMATAAAVAAQQMRARSMLLPPSIANKQQQLGGLPSCSSNTVVSSSSSVAQLSRSGSRVMQRQESSCSSNSRSRSSFSGSVASYQQQIQAAQQQAQLLASASLGDLQACRLSGMLWQWEELRQLLKQSDHGATFALPMLLLSLAALMDEVFSSRFPTWGHTCSGAHNLQAITAAPAHVLDPHHSYWTLSVLAGSPAAIESRQRHDAGPFAAVDKRRRRMGVSSVVAAAVAAEPRSPALRRMMHAAGETGAKCNTDQQQLGTGDGAAWSTKMGAAALHTAAARRMTKLVNRR